MTRFSARRAVLVGLLLTIALAPMVSSRFAPPRDECPGNAALLDAAALDPRLEVVREGLKKTEIEKGRLLAMLPAEGPLDWPMLVSVDRTLGLPHRLVQPALVFPGRREPDEIETKIVATPHGDLPLLYAFERRGRSTRVMAYFMAHRLEGISSPLWTRLEHGASSLFTGRWPITLVAISGRARPGNLEERLEWMDAWLLHAWDHYRSVCTPAASSTSDSRPL